MPRLLLLVLLAAGCAGHSETEIIVEEGERCVFAASQNDLKELMESQHATGRSGQVVGNTKQLTSDGQLTTDPRPQLQTQALLEHAGPAQAWVISLKGTIQEVIPGNVYPFGMFVVQWTIGGTSFETQIDGFSDQFLVVYAQQVRIFCQWDFANADTVTFSALHFPKSMLLSASICPAQGATTIAKRTLFLQNGAFDSVKIPYSARGFIVRSSDPNYFGQVTQQTQVGSQAIDQYDAVDVAAAHGRGEHLSVASVADVLFILYAGGPLTDNGFIEFLLQP